MNINSPKNLDSSFNIATSDEKLMKSCKHANHHILPDDIKVDEEPDHCHLSVLSFSVEFIEDNVSSASSPIQ